MHQEETQAERQLSQKEINRKHRRGKRSGRGKPTSEKKQQQTVDSRLYPLNDFSWYNENPALTVAAGSLPFPYRPGMSVPVAQGTLGTPVRFTLPGVMVLHWAPSIGKANNQTDPANVAAKEIYARVRNAFSGSLDADPPDYIIYLMCLDSVFSYIAALKRIFRILITYSPDNYALPETLLTGIGFTVDQVAEMQRDRMRLFQVVNELVGMTRKFRCPRVFPLFDRHYWMSDNVYADAAEPNSQMYVFCQDYFYKYALLKTPDDVNAGGASWVEAPWKSGITSDTVGTLFSFGRGLLNTLAGSDDAYTISGYLMRAFQDTEMFVVDEISLEDKFDLVYVEEVLWQIENSFPVEYSTVSINTVTGNISQDPTENIVIHNPALSGAPSETLVVNPMISSRLLNPGVAEVVESTRLMANVDPTTGTIDGASEIPLYWNVVTANPSGTGVLVQKYDQFIQLTLASATAADLLSAVQSILACQAFDWHPFGRVCDATTRVAHVVGDVHNVTVVSQETLSNLHRVCMYSLFKSFGQI